MLSLNQCRKILEKTAKEFTDEQLQAIINFLYKLAGTNIEYIKEQLNKIKQKKANE
jgi:uncharacterized protein YpuA (DUF1002 family)